MAPTDSTERGLETLIVDALTGQPTGDGLGKHAVKEAGPPWAAGGFVEGSPADYDREHAVDAAKLFAFLQATQPAFVEAAGLAMGGEYTQADTRRTSWRTFLHRLQGEVAKRGVVDVLRKGVKNNQHHVDLFYGTPTPGNATAAGLYAANIFSVTRQLRYSKDETQLALDLALFVNGLPFATFELKNSFTKQTVDDAIRQYQRDRDPKEPLFAFGRCAVHFAVDDAEVRMCTHLQGKASWFLPFNKGWDDGAGNPPNPHGLKTAYLWEELLARPSLTDIIENYAQVVEEKDERTGRKRHVQIFPRYHQLDVVRELLAAARRDGPGQRYLIQHSAGSGKSNSIAWLAHQLVDLSRDGQSVFDTIVVVTDRKVLDQQIKDTIKQFAQVAAVVGHAEDSGDLHRMIQSGKKIVISTVQKFPRILAEIGNEHRDRRFAILIDEAHSSQGGRTAGQMNLALSGRAAADAAEGEDIEDQINRHMEARKMLPNASYFAFTATPKNKTLEIFGEPADDAGQTRHRPFHSYTMKQAIQEGFILDVLAHYTPVHSFYRLTKTVEGDPEFDARKARGKLRKYVESNDHAIRTKSEIMVDHFHDSVAGANKIGGQARAMVVTSGVERAVQYFHAISAYLIERKSPYKAIVAFSGEYQLDGRPVTEATLNGFPSARIADKFEEEPYRFLVVADKFQTGYDQPLLHTMYVDKPLSGVKAVQTLSRLNRAHPRKHDTFVLDFLNDADTIAEAFEPYYRTTILSAETDPNKLHDLQAELEGYQVYAPAQVETLVARFLGGTGRENLDPILDECVAVYVKELDEDGQVAFKGSAKAFARTYSFLATILPYTYAPWEKLSIFLNFLIPKLPAPKDEDLARGILETIDMDSYRAEVEAQQTIDLADAEGRVEPVPMGEGGFKPEPELEPLSAIVRGFNEQFGNTEWGENDRVRKIFTEDVVVAVAADRAVQHAVTQGDRQNARVEIFGATDREIEKLVKDHIEVYRTYTDDQGVQKLVRDFMFKAIFGAPPNP